MAYSKHEWRTSEPITAQKMNDIENGIANIDNSLTAEYYNKTQIDDKVNTINEEVSNVRITANSAATSGSEGREAWNQIKDATVNNTPKYNTLTERLTAISGQAQSAATAASSTQMEVVNARFNRASLSTKIAEMDTQMTTLEQNIVGTRDEVQAARDGKTTLSAKINEIDDSIQALQEEIKAGDNTTTLTQKITAIKSDIADDKIDISNIKATIGAPITGTPEKTIRQIITDNATAAQSYTNTQLNNAKVGEIIEAHRNDEDTLDARFDDVESIVDTHGNSLTQIGQQIETISSNISDIQSEISEAHTETNTTLAMRFSDNEAVINDLQEEIVAAHRQNVANDSIAARFSAIDDSITELLNKSSTIIISEEDFQTLQDNIVNGIEEGNSNIDYIVGPDANGKYYYWKWINDSAEEKWKLISGAGSGNSSALVFESMAAFEAANKDENTDYYVKDVNGYYAHYRYTNNNGVYTRFEIKQDAYTTSQVYNKNEVYTKLETNNEIDNAIAAMDSDEYTMTYGKAPYGEDQTETDNVLTLYRRKKGAVEPSIASQVIIAGGGGGGPVTGATITLNRITQSPVIMTPTDKAIISIEYSCIDDAVEITGYYTWSKGTQILLTGTLTQGINTFDLTQFCSIGTQRLKLSVTNENNSSAPPKYWDIQMVDVRIESNFNDKYVYNGTDYVNFTYIPYGAVNKTVHIKLDGTEIETINTTVSGTSLSYSLPPQTHGAHLLETYITATINNKNIETNHIYKDIIWAHSGNRTPIIGCIYRYDYYGPISIRQYNSFAIPYYVYDPRSSSPTIILYENEKEVNSIKITTAQNTWAYKSNTVTQTEEDEGTPNSLVIACGSTEVEIKANITELGYDIQPITTNLAFDFNPSGYSNGDVLHRLWNYTSIGDKTTSLSVSDNFDWNNGGYQLDEEGNTYFCVKSGTRAYINYKLFETDPKNNGAEFKIIFKTTNVENVTASFLRCLTDDVNNNVGLEMRAHEAYFSTSSNTLEIPYSEEDVIEFEYNINPINIEDQSATSYIMTYEDGVGARPLIYNNDTNLNQSAPASIIEIGSDNCDVWIYRMKAYTSALSDIDILNNFYADARSSDEMIARYERNQIYDENGQLTPKSVAAACPDLKVIMIEAPYFTNDKKDYVKGTNVQCIHVNGRPRDNWYWENGYHVGQGTSSNRYGAAGRNIDLIFGFDGEHTVVSKIKESDVKNYVSQIRFGDGTILTGADAKINLSENSIENSWFNIKVNIASSENANNALLQKRFNDYLPYKSPARQRDSRVKNSMEFYNCVIFIKESDETQNEEGIYTSHREFPRDTNWHFYGIGNIGDSKKTDNTRVNNPNDIKEFCVEVSDNNLPNSMFQTGVYRLDDGSYTFTPPNNDSERMARMVYPITEAQWEDERNLARKALSLEGYVSGQKLNEDTGEMEDVITNWDSSFEFRYDMGTKDGESFPGLEEQQELSKLKWNEMYKWVITCPDNKFAEELGNWFIVDSPLYWYLFTERYIMIDNRAKNSFYHYGKIYITEEEAAEMGDDARNYTIDNAAAAINEGYRFELWNYDDDTALGIDNSGLLKIPYGKEDIDKDELGAYIYNAAENIFWRRIRQLMGAQLTTLYTNTNLTNCWSANNLINEFDRWQNQFPEELWRLDIERKYIRPYKIGSWNSTTRTYNTDKTFLEGMANGRKKYQRRQFERDQEIYLATKYLQSAILADSVEMRLATANAESTQVVPVNDTIKITPYSDMYIRVMFGNTDTVSRRAKAGIEYEISPPSPITSRNTLQITVYAASRIQAFNDLSAFYIRDNNFSRATKLKTLVLGNPTPGYKNTALTTVGIGDNTLLETLDLRNLPNLSGSLNLINCKNLTNLYATNTALTSVSFATNGKITNAYLPETLNNLVFRNLKMLSNLNISGYSRLTSFICEDSNITDPLNIVNQAINTLTTIRITGLAWELSNINILNNIYNKTESMLSGLVTLINNAAIKREEIIKYEEKWPDLTLNTENAKITEQWTVSFTYTDINGTAHTFKEYVEHGEPAPDPMTEGLLDPVPGKPSEIEVDYVFGTWTQNSSGELVYNEFSGWRTIAGGVPMTAVGVTGNIDYEAVYYETPRKYSVEWYVDNVKVDETTTNYGSEAVTTYVPENKWDRNTNTAKVFNGWDKNTGEVKENLVGQKRVNAMWIVDTIPTSSQLQASGLNGLNEAQLYALSQMEQGPRSQLLGGADGYIGDYKEFTLGKDYDFTNVESTVLVDEDTILGFNVGTKATDERTIKVYDNQLHYGNTLPEIRPLNSNEGFTIALDYEVYSGINRAYLMSCYQYLNDTEKGFQVQVINGNDIYVSWGSSSATENGQIVNKVGNRGTLVLRKPYNSNDLVLYYDDDANLAANIKTTRLTGNNNIINVPLVLGSYAIVNEDTGAITLPPDKVIANSIIHWGKYWAADLGDTVCKELALSCHEKIKFRLQGFNDSNVGNVYKTYEDGNRGETVGLSFIAMTPLQKSYVQSNAGIIINESNGWQDSELRSICNNRIYNSLPVALKSIISQTPTRYFGKVLAQVGDAVYNNQYTYTQVKQLLDYIYIPTYYELKGINTQEPYPEGIRHPIPWITTRSMYSESGIVTSSIDISRITFKYKPISNTTKFFNYPTNRNPFTYSNTISNVSVSSGDVWVPSSGVSGTVAYMYVTQEEINKYNLTITPGTNFECSLGGWIPADRCWTRTLQYQSYADSYYYVEERGSVENASGNYGNVFTNGVLLQFSI